MGVETYTDNKLFIASLSSPVVTIDDTGVAFLTARWGSIDEAVSSWIIHVTNRDIGEIKVMKYCLILIALDLVTIEQYFFEFNYRKKVFKK